MTAAEIIAMYSASPVKEMGPRCQHCSRSIYIGLHDLKCPNGCDLTLQACVDPEDVTIYQIPARDAQAVGLVLHPVLATTLYHEDVWYAELGCFRAVHPIREEAIRLCLEKAR